MHISPGRDADRAAARVLAVDLVGPIKLTAMFLRRFPFGEVAHITSGAAHHGIAHWGLYCAAKAGMEAYLRALDAEGVVTFDFDPGVVDTDMQSYIRKTDFPDAKRFISWAAEGRLKRPEEVASRFVEAIGARQAV
jgi:benzil reductase ((S)-benzoin forming)